MSFPFFLLLVKVSEHCETAVINELLQLKMQQINANVFLVDGQRPYCLE